MQIFIIIVYFDYGLRISHERFSIMKTRRIFALAAALATLLMMFSFAACNGTTPGGNGDGDTKLPTENEKVTVEFNGTEYTANFPDTIKSEGSAVTITRAGVYELSGTFEGQIIVEVEKTAVVELIFNGLTATSKTSAPIYIKSADRCKITLAEGTTNTFTDADFYVFEGNETKPNACIYSSEDLTIEGNGTLIVNGNFNNGIGSKNDLRIAGGNITVNAIKNALKGNDKVKISDGTINIESCTDGIKSDSIDPGKGTVTIEGGSITINADDDGIQAEQAITISGGSVTVDAYGKSVNCKSVDSNAVTITEGCLTVVQ